MNNYIQVNSDYVIRTENHQGKEFLVVPVIMMNEGVHSGSHGTLFHSITELGKYPASWDGIPVTISHPQRNGGNVSANSPQVIEEEAIGRVYNTFVDGIKLKAEAWLDTNLMAGRFPEVLRAIKDQKPIDVSVGVFTDEEDEGGQYQGKDYTAIAHNHRPDHLALLPNEVGACSWGDGCGIRNNMKGGNQLKKLKNEELKTLARKGFAVVQINEQGFRELVNLVQTKLDAMDTNTSSYYLEEIYPNYFVYRICTQEQPDKYFKRNYVLQADETVEFTGDPEQVKKDISYNIITNKFKRTKGVQNMEEKKKECCPEKVDALILNKASNFTKEDRKWLTEQDEVTINKLIPKEIKVKKEEVKVEVNKQEIINDLKESFKTPEEFIAFMPEGMQDQMKSGLALHNAHREGLQKSILDNTKDAWVEDELKTMSTSMLEKIAKSIPEVVDFSLNGNNTVPTNVVDEQAMYPADVKMDEK